MNKTTLLPDAVKIAALLNETEGPLQQHLQLEAANIAKYAQIRSMAIEYYRATATFTRLQASTSGSNNQGPAPMGIGATRCNKGKGKKGKRKGKERIQQRQRLRELREQLQLQRRNRQTQSTTQQLALPQPPQLADPSVVPISGLREVTVATIGAVTHRRQQQSQSYD